MSGDASTPPSADRGAPTVSNVVAPSGLAPDVRGTASALAPVVEAVDLVLDEILAQRAAQLEAIDPGLESVGREIGRLVRGGGKRLRPAFVYWGHRATGAAHDEVAIAAGAAVELLHGFALIQDDVMDRASQRRGQPTVHEVLAQDYRDGALRGSAEASGGKDGPGTRAAGDSPDGATSPHDPLGDAAWFGYSAAILASDLAVAWAGELLATAVESREHAVEARRVFADLRVEVIGGQYLDLRLAGLADATAADALRVALLKSGRYTVTRPLQLGATIAGADPELLTTLQVYGDAVGTAFQLRDDVLGLFGDPRKTGKSALGDLREGKRTLLMIAALERADDAQRGALLGTLGDPQLDEAAADRVRDIVVDTGTLAYVEELSEQRQRTARDALVDLPDPARTALGELADLVVSRVT